MKFIIHTLLCVLSWQNRNSIVCYARNIKQLSIVYIYIFHSTYRMLHNICPVSCLLYIRLIFSLCLISAHQLPWQLYQLQAAAGKLCKSSLTTAVTATREYHWDNCSCNSYNIPVSFFLKMSNLFMNKNSFLIYDGPEQSEWKGDSQRCMIWLY